VTEIAPERFKILPQERGRKNLVKSIFKAVHDYKQNEPTTPGKKSTRVGKLAKFHPLVAAAGKVPAVRTSNQRLTNVE